MVKDTFINKRKKEIRNEKYNELYYNDYIFILNSNPYDLKNFNLFLSYFPEYLAIQNSMIKYFEFICITSLEDLFNCKNVFKIDNINLLNKKYRKCFEFKNNILKLDNIFKDILLIKDSDILKHLILTSNFILLNKDQYKYYSFRYLPSILLDEKYQEEEKKKKDVIIKNIFKHILLKIEEENTFFEFVKIKEHLVIPLNLASYPEEVDKKIIEEFLL